MVSLTFLYFIFTFLKNRNRRVSCEIPVSSGKPIGALLALMVLIIPLKLKADTGQPTGPVVNVRLMPPLSVVWWPLSETHGDINEVQFQLGSDVSLGSHWSLGPRVSYYETDLVYRSGGDKIKDAQYLMEGYYFLKSRTESTFFAALTLGYEVYDFSPLTTTSSESHRATTIAGLSGGYQYFLTSNINVGGAIGIKVPTIGDQLLWQLFIGYTFF